MKTKHTPEFVLTMLKELKSLVDNKKFVASEFNRKYSSYYKFRIFIFSKGLMKKNYGIEEWVSIEPNLIMAKELLKLYFNYSRENSERYKNKLKQKNSNNILISPDDLLENIKNQEFEKPEDVEYNSPPFTSNDLEKRFPKAHIQDLKNLLEDKKEHIEFLNEQIESLHETYREKIQSTEIKYEQLQEELKRLRKSLSNQETANNSLKQRLDFSEKGIDDNVQMLLNKNNNLKETIKEQEQEIKELKKLKIEKEKSISTYKILGIPLFSKTKN
jgi:chromosome segregation ATPase